MYRIADGVFFEKTIGTKNGKTIEHKCIYCIIMTCELGIGINKIKNSVRVKYYNNIQYVAQHLFLCIALKTAFWYKHYVFSVLFYTNYFFQAGV